MPLSIGVVKSILRNFPKASLDTFEKYFMVKDLLVDTAFSKSHIIKGSETVGSITHGGNPVPNYARILKACPTIKIFCDEEGGAGRIDDLIAKCHIIALEIFLEKTRNPVGYLGTPDDQRMVETFGDIFGPIHIGPAAVSSGKRVTDLEFIRWRATLFGANGQIERDAKKRLQESEKKNSRMRQSVLGSEPETQTATDQSGLAVDASLSASDNQPQLTDQLAISAPPAQLGKKCSNLLCPDNTRYYAAMCKLWTKCPKDCTSCAKRRDKGGQIHVCPNILCKAVLRDHIASSHGNSSAQDHPAV